MLLPPTGLLPKRRGGFTRWNHEHSSFFLAFYSPCQLLHQEFMSRDKKGLAEVVENNRRILKLTVRGF